MAELDGDQGGSEGDQWAGAGVEAEELVAAGAFLAGVRNIHVVSSILRKICSEKREVHFATGGPREQIRWVIVRIAGALYRANLFLKDLDSVGVQGWVLIPVLFRLVDDLNYSPLPCVGQQPSNNLANQLMLPNQRHALSALDLRINGDHKIGPFLTEVGLSHWPDPLWLLIHNCCLSIFDYLETPCSRV